MREGLSADLSEFAGTFVEYRAVGFDRDTERTAEDPGPVRTNRREAVRDLERMCDEADPPYDDGWIEKRIVTAWHKSTDSWEASS